MKTGEAVVQDWIANQPRPVTPHEVKENTGLPDGSVRSYLKRLSDTGKIIRIGKGLYGVPVDRKGIATNIAAPVSAPRTLGTLFDAQGVLRRLRRSLRASTPEAFSDALGISLNVLKTWEAENTFSLDVILSASRREKISLDWLLHGDHAEPGTSTKAEPEQWHGIPVYSSAQAGGLVAYEIDPHAYDHVPVHPSAIGARNEHVFGLRVQGHSMYPYYLPGDIAICSADRSARVGQDVVLIRHGLGESTLKRLEHWEGQTAVLRPLHPRFRSQVVEIDPEDRLYPVIGLWRVPAEAEPWAWDKNEPEQPKKAGS